jgi:hypothetical protein
MNNIKKLINIKNANLIYKNKNGIDININNNIQQVMIIITDNNIIKQSIIDTIYNNNIKKYTADIDFSYFENNLGIIEEYSNKLNPTLDKLKIQICMCVGGYSDMLFINFIKKYSYFHFFYNINEYMPDIVKEVFSDEFLIEEIILACI